MCTSVYLLSFLSVEKYYCYQFHQLEGKLNIYLNPRIQICNSCFIAKPCCLEEEARRRKVIKSFIVMLLLISFHPRHARNMYVYLHQEKPHTYLALCIYLQFWPKTCHKSLLKKAVYDQILMALFASRSQF